MYIVQSHHAGHHQHSAPRVVFERNATRFRLDDLTSHTRDARSPATHVLYFVGLGCFENVISRRACMPYRLDRHETAIVLRDFLRRVFRPKETKRSVIETCISTPTLRDAIVRVQRERLALLFSESRQND